MADVQIQIYGIRTVEDARMVIDMGAHHIGAPDYVAITRELKERGLYDGPVKVIEEDTIELVREVLAG